MNTDILKSAEPLKCTIIDFILEKFSNCIIGNEVMYGCSKKVVDLLLIRDSNLYAIEIKGDHDNLNLLDGQIQEYEKVFDYITVYSTPKHANALKEKLPNHIGLYIIDNENIIQYQKEKKIHKFDKKEMLYSINTKYFLKVANITNKDTDKTRSTLSKKSIDFVHSLLVDFFTKKISTRFSIFLKEKGNKTHIDDITLLSSNITISI